MDELEYLYEQKKTTTDKVELRKIRAKIRRELRKRGEYTPTRAGGYTAPRRRKKRELAVEEYALKRTRATRNKMRREELAGQRAVINWRRLGPLHTKKCRCVACVLKIPHLGERPPREVLLKWFKILKRGGEEGINRIWLEKTWTNICIKGKIPKKNSRAAALIKVMMQDGWY